MADSLLLILEIATRKPSLVFSFSRQVQRGQVAFGVIRGQGRANVAERFWGSWGSAMRVGMHSTLQAFGIYEGTIWHKPTHT